MLSELFLLYETKDSHRKSLKIFLIKHHISVFRQDKEKFSSFTENYDEFDRFIAFQMDSAHPDVTCDLITGECQVQENSIFNEKRSKKLKKISHANAPASIHSSFEMTVFIVSAMISSVIVLIYKLYYDKKSGLPRSIRNI